MPTITFLCDEVKLNLKKAKNTDQARMHGTEFNSLILSPHDVSSPHSGVHFREFHPHFSLIPDTNNYIKRFQCVIDTIKDPAGPWFTKLTVAQQSKLINCLDKIEKDFHSFFDSKNKPFQQRKFSLSTNYSSLEILLSEFHKEMITYFNNILLPEILKLISSSAEYLRRAEIRYQSKQGRSALLHVFSEARSRPRTEHLPSRYFSYQKSIGRYTQNQLAYLNKTAVEQYYFKNCYDRFETGVANLQWQVAGYVKETGDNGVQLSSAYLRHSNIYRTHTEDPLPKQYHEAVLDAEQIIETAAEKVFIERCQGQDASAFAAQYDEANPMPISLHELRLMSVLNKNLDNVDPDQRGRWQMENNFIAFNLCQKRPMKIKVVDAQQQEHFLWVKPEIALSDFGVNVMRHEELNDPLQSWMNTRALNKLWQNVTAQMPHGEFRDIFTTIEENLTLKQWMAAVKDSQKQLSKRYYTLQTFVKSNHHSISPATIARIRQYRDELLHHEAQHYLLEKQLLDLRFNLFNQKKQELLNAINNPFAKTINGEDKIEKSISQLWLNLLTLFQNAQYTHEKNTYLLPAMWGLITQQLGIVFASGCNDNKDRGSRLAEKIESLTIFYHKHGCYPRLYDAAFEKQDRAEIYRIEAIVHERSTAIYGTELSSLPGCMGEQVKASDGNGHLNLLHRHHAELGKIHKGSHAKVGTLNYIHAGIAFVGSKIASTVDNLSRPAVILTPQPEVATRSSSLLVDIEHTTRMTRASSNESPRLNIQDEIREVELPHIQDELISNEASLITEKKSALPKRSVFNLIGVIFAAIATFILIANPVASIAHPGNHFHGHETNFHAQNLNNGSPANHAHRNTSRFVAHVFRVAEHRESHNYRNDLTAPKPISNSRSSDPNKKENDENDAAISDLQDSPRKIHRLLNTPLDIPPPDAKIATSNQHDLKIAPTPTPAYKAELNIDKEKFKVDKNNTLDNLMDQTLPHSREHIHSPLHPTHTLNENKWSKMNQAVDLKQKTVKIINTSIASHQDLSSLNQDYTFNTHHSEPLSKGSAIKYYLSHSQNSELPKLLPKNYFYNADDYSNPSLIPK